jgi:hypothetical protein
MNSDPDCNHNPNQPTIGNDGSGQASKPNGDERVDPVEAIRLAGEILAYAKELPGVVYAHTDSPTNNPRWNDLSSRLNMISGLQDDLCVAAGVKTTTWEELYFRKTAIIAQMQRHEQCLRERKEVVVVEVARYPEWLWSASIFVAGVAIGIILMGMVLNS